MLLGFHVIFSTYGFWLPNDPRGSWSDWVRKWELVQYGRATKVQTRRSVAGVRHDRTLRESAKKGLTYPEVHLTGLQARSVGRGIHQAALEGVYAIHACSILPQHVHMVLGPHNRRVGRIVGHLKGRASQQMKRDSLHPLEGFKQSDGTIPSPWARKCWKVFIFSQHHLRDAIAYVEDNPIKEGKPSQRWSFVQPHIASARSKLRR